MTSVAPHLSRKFGDGSARTARASRTSCDAWARPWIGPARCPDARCRAVRPLLESADRRLVQYFTLDEPRSRAVTEAFVRLHERGLIYRDNRIIHWCCQLRTAISDVEVDVQQVTGRTTIALPHRQMPVTVGLLHTVQYPLADDSGDSIPVATTRLETMPGDVAIAVHPRCVRSWPRPLRW